MQLLSFSTDKGASWGAVLGDGVIDLGARLSVYPTLRSVLEAQALPLARSIVEARPQADHRLDQVRFEPVIPDPSQILCIGLNYEEHRVESRKERSGHPTVFSYNFV